MTEPSVTIDALERWVQFGAHWRLVDLSHERAVVDLCAWTGETVERLESEDPELVRYVRSARSSNPQQTREEPR